jgi:two-component system, NtrC family, sensor kinase
MIQISIEDNGIGIPSDCIAQIFDPFFTTKPVGQGMGLGLALCYQVIERMHQGRLSCHSEPNQGSCFTIELTTLGQNHLQNIGIK